MAIKIPAFHTGVRGEWFCWNWSGGVEDDPQTKFFGHHWGGRPHPVGKGVNPANPLANRTLVAMPSVMAARWVCQNSGPLFRRLWTKVGLNRNKFSRAGGSVRSLQRRFPIADELLHSGDMRDQLSRQAVRNRAEILMFWAAKFRGGVGRGHPNF